MLLCPFSGGDLCWNWNSHANLVCSFLSGINKSNKWIRRFMFKLTCGMWYCKIVFKLFYLFLFNLFNQWNLCIMIFFMQYLKYFQTRQVPILEQFALLITTTVIWAYAHLLTASGAYKHRLDVTQHSCRRDRANLISFAPWLVPIAFLWLNICILCINVAKKILTLEHVGAG
jgi:hypothetical protein